MNVNRTREDNDRHAAEVSAEAVSPARADVRLSVNLRPDVAADLKDYAERKGVSITEAVRRAIVILKFVDDARDRGAAFNVEENGSLKEVLFIA